MVAPPGPGRLPNQQDYLQVTYLNRYLKEKNILRGLFPGENPRKGKFLEEKSRRKILEGRSSRKNPWKGKSEARVKGNPI